MGKKNKRGSNENTFLIVLLPLPQIMGNSKNLIKFILPLLLVVTQTSALKCNCEGYFCVSAREYALCQAGEVVGNPIPCREGIICRNETGNECSRQHKCQERQNSPDGNSSVDVKKLCQGELQSADPDNCQRFYLCSGFGTGQLMHCPTNTYYNEKTFMCTTYKPERCGSTNDPVMDRTDEYITDTPFENENTFECSGIGLFVNPQNCQQYYQCDETNSSFLKDCAEGTYFDENLEDCVSSIPERCRGLENQLPNAEEVTTEDIISTTQTSQTNQDDTGKTTMYPEDDEESTSQTTVNALSTQQTTDNVEDIRTTRIDDPEGNTDGTITSTLSPPKHEGSFMCPGEGYYPDPDDCRHYYVCYIVGQPMRVSCPEGTYYDEEFCSSDIPERCRVTSTPSYVSTTVKNDLKTEKFSTKIPDESEDQTTEGMISTTTSTPNRFVCPGEGIYLDPENCHRYYICNSIDDALSLVCPNGSYYDIETSFCSSDKPKRCEESENTSDNISTASTTQPTRRETDSKEIETPTTEGTTVTTGNPHSDFECPEEGYFTDRKNCHNYFACFNSGDSYVAIPVSCPGNTYFDEESEFCTEELPEGCSDQHVHSTTRSPNHDDKFSCPGDGYYADPNDCTLYYMCYADSATLLACSNGTYFNEENDFCTEEMPEKCRDSENTHRPTTTSFTERPTTDKDNNGFTCPGEGYYSDPENCQYYYICYNWGRAIPVSCPDNTYFHEESTFCMKELPERCRVTGRPPENQVITTSSPPTEEEFTCPGEGYYPDPKDCQNYYICFGENQVIPLSCPNNTFYDEESSFCRNKIPERCLPTGKPTEDSAHTTAPPIYDSNMTSTTSAPMKDEFTCPEEGYYPHPKDCRRYYACYGFGAPLMLTCPEDTYFDEKGFCTLERPERCSPNAPEYSTKPPQQQETEKEFKCSGSGQFPDPKSCRKYWVCHSKNFGYSVQCPNDTYYHQDSTYCTMDKPERCKKEDDEDFRCPGEGYFPDPSDCHTYHICYSRSVSIPVRCPGNSYYHQSMKGCALDVPETCKNEDNGKKFVCPRAGYFPDPRDCSRYYVCNFWGDAFLAKCPQDRYFNENIRGCSSEVPPRCRELTPPLQNGFICFSSGYFPDPVNCNKYHVCNIFGHHYTTSCPRNTYYHEETRTCSPIIPERCVYLGSGRSIPNTATSPERSPILSDTGYPLNDTFVCPGKGLFPDPYDCQKFYVCYGQARQVTCWGETYFNETTQQCEEDMPERCKTVEDPTVTPQPDLSASTPQSEEFLCPSDGFFPHPTDCRKFYVCYGQMRLVTCHEGMYYNEETQQCGQELPDRCESGQGNGESRPPSPPSTNPGEKEFICPDEGLFPDPQNCHRFYVCYGQPRQVTCRNGMYFNEITKQCDMEMPERCKNNGGGEVTPQPTNPPLQPGEFACPDKGLFAHPGNCHKFYVCYGETREVTCWGDTYYDEETQKCVEDLPERCKSNGDGDVTPLPTAPSTTSRAVEFECPDNGLFPDPEDCQKFYVCYGEKRHVTCRNGMYFHEDKQECREELPDRCSSSDDISTSTTTETPTSTTPRETYECQNPGRYPDPFDCQSFYFCNWRQEVFHFNCKDSTYFNDVTSKCEPHLPDRCKSEDDRDTTTTPRLPPAFVCTESGRFPDPENCLNYFYCSNDNSIPIRYACPMNEFFNANKGKCKKIKTGNECSMANPDDIQSKDDDSDEDDEDFMCTQPGLFPDHRNCKKFYECSSSLKMKHKTCSGRTYFNEIFRHCSIFTTQRCKKFGFFW